MWRLQVERNDSKAATTQSGLSTRADDAARTASRSIVTDDGHSDGLSVRSTHSPSDLHARLDEEALVQAALTSHKRGSRHSTSSASSCGTSAMTSRVMDLLSEVHQWTEKVSSSSVLTAPKGAEAAESRNAVTVGVGS